MNQTVSQHIQERAKIALYYLGTIICLEFSYTGFNIHVHVRTCIKSSELLDIGLKANLIYYYYYYIHHYVFPEIPEIEEELVCGAAADDFDSCDILEEEIEEVEEELDDIVTVAREACEELDSMAEDPIIVEKTQRPNTSRLLKK